MFEDIIISTKKIKKTFPVLLRVNNKEYALNAYDVKILENTIEGLIVDSEQQPDQYTSYMLSITSNGAKLFKVIVERIDSNTLKFYTPTGV